MFRILVFTDEGVVAAGLKRVLVRKNGFRVAAFADSPATLIETAEESKPDLLLLDMTPEITFGVLVELQKRIPDCRIVIWVRTISKELAYQAIEHGIRGILRKTLPCETLLKCLRLVAEGGLWFEESLKAGFLAAKAITLSKRESQLVSLLSQGLKNKEIASLLLISEGTVKVYLSRLFRKLGVNDRFELALYGLKNMPPAEVTQEPRSSTNGSKTLRKDADRAEWLRSLLLDRPPDRTRDIAS
jgi:DNA-binding NarL/FixJ family response regulator